MFSKQLVQSNPISIWDSFLRIIKAGAELNSNTNPISRFRNHKAVNPLYNRLHGMQKDEFKFDVY
jgi:hypothetical protein